MVTITRTLITIPIIPIIRSLFFFGSFGIELLNITFPFFSSVSMKFFNNKYIQALLIIYAFPRISPINSIQHKYVCLKNLVVCKGGNSDESIPFILRLNLSKFIVPKIECEKCQSVRGFALLTDGMGVLFAWLL